MSLNETGDRIRERRRALGLSQADLAEAMQRISNGGTVVTQCSVSRWERGACAVALRSRIALCRVLQLAPTELFSN